MQLLPTNAHNSIQASEKSILNVDDLKFIQLPTTELYRNPGTYLI